MKPLVEDSTTRDTSGLARWPVIVMIGLGLVFAAALAPPRSEARAQSDPGAALFSQHCASCHQADGSGVPGTFPPLLGNPASADAVYVADVIRNGLSGPLEVNGVSYDGVMPAVPALEGADLEAVVAYVGPLADGSGEPDEPEAEEPDVEGTVAPVVGDAERGHEYFRGSRRFDEGGAACASCHTAGADGNLGGPGLGPDLTLAFETLGGEVGLTGWLSNPPSATMSPIFSERPMNDEEVADLVAYLETTPSVERNDPAVDLLLLAGLAGLVVLFAGMGIAWQGMRQTYVERLRSQR